MHIIILIMTHNNNINYIKTIAKTWAKNINHKYYFVTSDKLDIGVPTIKLKGHIEMYEQLPMKTYLALQHVFKNHKFTHIIKVNDDTFVDMNKFKEAYLAYDYVGKFNTPGNNPFVHYYKCSEAFRVPKLPTLNSYAQGGFVVLSRNAVKKIISQHKELFVNTPSTYKGEDVLLGEILSSAVYKKLDIKDAYSDKMNLDITNDFLSLHPIDYKIMHKLLGKSNKSIKKILCNSQNLNDNNKRDKFVSFYLKSKE